MKRAIIVKAVLTAILIMPILSAKADIVSFDPDENYSRFLTYDRYLDVEIWTDDEEYFEGDDIQISFQANEDCFVAIYNIDTRGRVHLIFPEGGYDDNFIEGDRIYNIPGRYDEYNLTVQGPPGIEHLHIVGSKKPFNIPDWNGGSGLVCDYDPYDFMEYIDASYFGGQEGLRRAFDMTSFYVEEWHGYYFRPVYVDHHYHDHYYHPYWDWGWYGSVYIDYPFGATIYIDGVYWGIAPLFIPRIYYGWHYITVYDHYGYCWEDRIEVIRTRSIALNETIIKTRPGNKSRFKEVRTKAYLDPAKNGYPNYQKDIKVKKTFKPISQTEQVLKNNIVDDSKYRRKNTESFTSDKRRKTSFDSGEYDTVRKSEKTGGQSETEKRIIKSTNESRKADSDKRGRTSESDNTYKARKSDKSDKSGSSYKRSGSTKKSSGTSKSYKKSGSSSSKKSSGTTQKKSSGSIKKSGTSSSGSSSSKKSSSGTTSSKSSSGKSSGTKSGDSRKR